MLNIYKLWPDSFKSSNMENPQFCMKKLSSGTRRQPSILKRKIGKIIDNLCKLMLHRMHYALTSLHTSVVCQNTYIVSRPGRT